MRKLISYLFLIVFLFTIMNYTINNNNTTLAKPNNSFNFPNINSTPTLHSLLQKLHTSNIPEITSAGLPFPLEGELNSYNRLQTTQMLTQLGSTITDVELDASGNVYVLGNYNTTVFNFTQTGLNTLGTQISFTSGTPSQQSSFILAYNSSGSFLYGKELDFNDNYDYYFVSLQPHGSNFVLLAERRPTLNFTPKSKVDIELFNYTSSFSSYVNAAFGDLARTTLGIPADFSYGLANIPTHLLRIDSQGNIFVAGMTKALTFPNSNTNYLNPYSHTYNFSATNLADPSYTNLSFTGNWFAQNSLLSANSSSSTIQFTSPVNQVNITSLIKNPNPLYNSIVGDFPFDENTGITTYDAVNNIPGTIYGATWQSGIYNNGLYFNGNDNNVTISQASAGTKLNFGSNPFTISTWIKTPGMNHTAWIFSKGLDDVVTGDEYALSYQVGGVLGVGIGNGTNTDFIYGTKTINDSLWHLVTMTVGPIGGSIILYVDGVLDTSITRTMSATGNTSANLALAFGELANHAGSPFYDYSFNGLIDNTMIFNKSLSLSEIQSLYQNSSYNIYDSNKKVTYNIYDARGLLLGSQTLNVNNSYTGYQINTFHTAGSIIKSLTINNTNTVPTFGQFNLVNISVDSQNNNLVTYDFEQYRGYPYNDYIGHTIEGVDFADWRASELIPGFSFSSGQRAIYNIVGNKNITFDTPTSAVSFYYSLGTYPGQYYTVEFIAQNNTILGSTVLTYNNATYVNFTTPFQEIKLVDIIPSYASYFNDLLIDDFSFSMGTHLFVLKLNSDLSENGSATLSEKVETTQVAITSIVLDNSGYIYVAGITTGMFSSNGTITPYQTLNFQSSGSGFISSFNNATLLFQSLTTIGNANHSAIYSLYYNNSKLFVGGQSLAVFAQSYWNPNILLSVYQPSNGSGMLAEFSPTDWNLLYYRSIGDPNVPIDGSAVTDVETQANYIYYSGVFNVSSSQSKFQTAGPYANGTITGLVGKLVPFIGIMNSTYAIVYSTLLPDYANIFSPMIVSQASGDIYWAAATGLDIYIYTYLDTDGDGLSDWNELNVYHTDPYVTDTDADGLSDAVEIYKYHTDPNNPDTDGDCIPDGLEVKYGTNPLYPDANVDTDGDGLTLLQEIQAGTSPNNPDTDGDGLTDYQEFMIYHTNGNNTDTDGDGLSDYKEVMN